MDGFGTIVGQVQAQIRGADHGGSLADDDYMFAPERREEANTVGPCIERFVVGEMDPTRKLTVSRSFVPGSPPSLAEKLGSKLAGASVETTCALQGAVAQAVAMGYLATCESEPRGDEVGLVSERTAEDIWDFWAPSCRDQLEDAGVPSAWAKMVRGMGADSLVANLKGLGLTRWLGGSKLNQLGQLYAQSGVLLRFTQTTAVPDEHFARTVTRIRQDSERPWRFDAYPI